MIIALFVVCAICFVFVFVIGMFREHQSTLTEARYRPIEPSIGADDVSPFPGTATDALIAAMQRRANAISEFESQKSSSHAITIEVSRLKERIYKLEQVNLFVKFFVAGVGGIVGLLGFLLAVLGVVDSN